MKINRHNYEAYLLDQLEGALSVEDQKELDQFLLLNPDCAPELEELEPVVLSGEKLIFQHPEMLKKVLPDHHSVLEDHNFDLFSIARMEGDLMAQQIRDHQVMLEADHQKAAAWKQWQKTRLVEEHHVYQNKEELKHRVPVKSRVLWISVFSAAAAIALLIILFRSGADLSQPDVITQAPEEEVYDQVQVQPKPENPAEAIAVEESDRKQDIVPAHFSTIQALEEQTETTGTVRENPYVQGTSHRGGAGEQDEIRPRVHAISAQLIPGTSAISKTEQDRIEPLQIEPVQVHMRSLTLAQISDMGFQEVVEEYAEENNLSLWKIAKAGIRGINKLAGSEISLLASHDEQGDISGYQLKSKRFSLTRPLEVEE